MDLDHRLVQLPGSSLRSGINSVHAGPDDACYEEHEVRNGRRGLCLFAVSTKSPLRYEELLIC